MLQVYNKSNLKLKVDLKNALEFNALQKRNTVVDKSKSGANDKNDNDSNRDSRRNSI